MNVSVYVHIPFCISKCSYCDFFSVTSCGEKIPDGYVTSLLKEKDFCFSRFNIDSVSSVYVGGGTPSLLSSHQLRLLINGILELPKKNCLPYTNSPEVTVEANPSDVSETFLSACHEAGVSRLSLGVQSLNEESLSFVSRRSNLRSIKTALSLIKDKWNGTLSVDLISGLPRETPASFAEGLSYLLKFKPHHISLYSLTVEEGTRLGDEILSGRLQYDYDDADEMWLAGRDILLENGYLQYEVSNFCLPCYECRHNMTYWQQENYIGIGAGAVGSIYTPGSRDVYGKRFSNTNDISSYCDFWNTATFSDDCDFSDCCDCNGASAQIPDSVQQVEMLDAATVKFEFFMMGLRTLYGVCRETYLEKFGTDFSHKTVSLFEDWKKRGMADITEKNGKHYYSLNTSGILFLNEFLEKL